MTVDYSLSEQIHASAKLKDVTSVMLWLGADIMLEYGLEEAKALLVRISPAYSMCLSCHHASRLPCVQEENLELAKANLETNTKDLELMKDYYTTVEVRLSEYHHKMP